MLARRDAFQHLDASAAPENASATAAAQAAAHVTLQVSSYAFGGGSQVLLKLYEGPNDKTMYTPPAATAK